MKRRLAAGAPHIVIFLAALATGLAMDFQLGLNAVRPGVDESYIFSFNRATAEGFRWGRDFVSTFGPYGFLITVRDLGSLPERRVLFEIGRGILAALAVAGYVGTLPARSLVVRFLWMFALCWAMALQGSEYRWLAPQFLLYVAALRVAWPRSLAVHGLAGGMAAHYLRDVGVGTGVTLLWPVSKRSFRLPYGLYAGACVALAVLAFTLAYSRSRP